MLLDVTGAGGVVGSALSRHAGTAYGVLAGSAAVGVAAVNGLLSRIPADLPLRGVIHAAGATRDGMFRGLTPKALEAVLPTKLDAVSHLDGPVLRTSCAPGAER
ncbi:KR domain-containing protein [Streptomyces luomodiensis]|uniref:KR domain-containing protein n=1 Tax=Streptomyces luomodiensis TaxID=3026192 RepID=A0ABY9UQ22_9ACTN|nr:KR domain-containing protein [Streptomyces sp. SCA4-21]WNE94618.1 KR domain-containing protein [Streptomyces sp. SCA4-21]